MARGPDERVGACCLVVPTVPPNLTHAGHAFIHSCIIHAVEAGGDA